MSPIRALFLVLSLAATGGVLAAWEALTGPSPALSFLYSSAEPSKLQGPAPRQAEVTREPDLGAQVRAMVETLHDLGDELARVRGMADAASSKANAVDRAQETLAAEFYSLAAEIKPKPRERQTTKARRAAPPSTACLPEK